jgi:hypothetical protein
MEVVVALRVNVAREECCSNKINVQDPAIIFDDGAAMPA